MGKVDRLGWTAGVIFEAFGVEFGVRSNAENLLELLEPLVPGAWKRRVQGDPGVQHLYSLKVGAPASRPGTRNYHLLYSGAARLARTLELAEALAELARDLPERLSQLAPRHVFLRAAALRWKSKVLVIPAEQESLVRDLRELGATILCEDFAVIDENLQASSWSDPQPEAIFAVLFAPSPEETDSTGFHELSRGESALRIFGLSASAGLKPQRDLSLSFQLAVQTRVGLGQALETWIREN